MGYWAGTVILANMFDSFFIALLFAGITSYVAEMLSRKINTIEL